MRRTVAWSAASSGERWKSTGAEVYDRPPDADGSTRGFDAGCYADLRRWRIMRRRSRAVRPPQIPSFSRAVIAYSRHGSRTGHSSQMALASSPSSSLTGWKISGFTPRQRARLREVLLDVGWVVND